MLKFRSALRVPITIVVWCAVVYPALAVFGSFVLPPDPSTQLFILPLNIIAAVVGAIVFVSRSGSLRQLGRFASAVFAVTVVVGLPLNVLFRVFGGFGSSLAVITALILIGVAYAGGYYLIYGADFSG